MARVRPDCFKGIEGWWPLVPLDNSFDLGLTQPVPIIIALARVDRDIPRLSAGPAANEIEPRRPRPQHVESCQGDVFCGCLVAWRDQLMILPRRAVAHPRGKLVESRPQSPAQLVDSACVAVILTDDPQVALRTEESL